MELICEFFEKALRRVVIIEANSAPHFNFYNPISEIASPCKHGEVAFGVETGEIPNSQMTSSSVWNAVYSAQKGRLYGVGSWIARRNDQNQWIQVDLGRKEVVTAIATQGRSNSNQWVKTFSVSYSLDGKTFESFKINGAVKVRIVL